MAPKKDAKAADKAKVAAKQKVSICLPPHASCGMLLRNAAVTHLAFPRWLTVDIFVSQVVEDKTFGKHQSPCQRDQV